MHCIKDIPEPTSSNKSSDLVLFFDSYTNKHYKLKD